MKKLPQFQYRMDSDSNRPNLDQYKNNSRYFMDRYQRSYGNFPPFQNGIPYNLMLQSLGQCYYPNYHFLPSQYSGNNFPTSMPVNWRDSQYMPGVINPNFGQPRNFLNSQFSRVALGEVKERDNHIVINLDSDQQDAQQAFVLPQNMIHGSQNFPKETVIEIEDDSVQKNVKQAIQAPEPQKLQLEDKKPKKPQVISKLLLDDDKKKPKSNELRTKPIRKLKKQPQRVEKNLKEKKSSDVSKIREHKKVDQLQKKKVDKTPKLASNNAIPEISKKKVEKVPERHPERDDSKREIAKYLESHGEIRHGKQFQSRIPQIKFFNQTSYRKWLEEKRMKVLNREIGTLTF